LHAIRANDNVVRQGHGINALRLAMFRAKHGGPSVGGARSRLSLARTASASGQF
jgi:hypothetical protein